MKQNGSILAGVCVIAAVLAVVLLSVSLNLPLSMVLLAIVALAIVIPETFDIFLAYQNGKNGKPTGVEGLGRVLMTFGIILIVGAALFYLLTIIVGNLGVLPTDFSKLTFTSIPSNVSNDQVSKIVDMVNKNNESIIETTKSLADVVKTAITALAGAITAIIGFYFGQKSSSITKAKPTEKPKLNDVNPSEGAPGVEVTLTGTDLGSSQESNFVIFGNIVQTAITKWEATAIRTKVPASATGQIEVKIIVNGVSSNTVPFKVV